MMEDAARISLNNYPWMSNPLEYIRENALAVLLGYVDKSVRSVVELVHQSDF